MMNNPTQQNQFQEETSLQPPKWLKFLFKIYGIIILIAVAFGMGSNLLAIIAINDFHFLSLNLLGILGMMAILGWGSWYLRVWVIPLLAFFGLAGIVQFFTDANITVTQQFATLITFFLFFIAYFYRQYFIGSYKAYPIYGVFAFFWLMTLVIYIIFGQPIFLSKQSTLTNEQISEIQKTAEEELKKFSPEERKILEGFAEFINKEENKQSGQQVLLDAISRERIISRNAKRISDILLIDLTLDSYYNVQSQYIYPRELFTLELPNHPWTMPNGLPTDPSTGLNYDYCVTNDLQHYALGAQLELDSGGAIYEGAMKDSIKQDNLPCWLNKICGQNGYYCESDL